MLPYQITPQDVIFNRDARPMEAGVGSGGHGGRWPEPSLLFDAVHAALHRAFPVPEENLRTAEGFRNHLQEKDWLWQHPHRYVAPTRDGRARNRNPGEQYRNQRFGSLQTAGPFPSVRFDGCPPFWLFPAPADYAPSDNLVGMYLCPLANPRGSSDLPMPLEYPLASACPPSKHHQSMPWWTKQAIEASLRGENPPPDGQWPDDELHATEWTTGIGIDPERQTQDGQRIYSAQYLRLREDLERRYQVSFGMCAWLPLGKQNGHGDGLKELFPKHNLVICGGQQRICQVEPLPGNPSLEKLLPISQPISRSADGKWRIKWLLLSPAIFPFVSNASPGGWLPNWIAATDGIDQGRPFKKGDVLLKPEIPPKHPGESRHEWRQRIARDFAPIKARLVAARVPKPIILSGWSERLHHIAGEAVEGSQIRSQKGARSTLLAVPAGAVYYFETEGPNAEAEAFALARALNWHGSTNGKEIKNRRSTLLGEKGFGLGVCGTWNFFENVGGCPNP